MTNEQKYSIQGIIRGVSQTTGQGKKGTWKRAGISIEKADGSNKMTVATFNEADIKIANEANGKEVKAVFTKSPSKDGNNQFNNLVEKGLTIVGQGESPVTQEEVIEEGKTPSVPINMTEKDAPKDGFQSGNTAPQIFNNRYETPEERARKQILIIRQHSQSLALEYVKLCMDGLKNGILTKDEFNKEDLNFDNILKISREKAETDVLRA